MPCVERTKKDRLITGIKKEMGYGKHCRGFRGKDKVEIEGTV